MHATMSYPDIYGMPKKNGASNVAVARKGGVSASDKQWIHKLSPKQYQVLRKKATELPNMGKFPETFDDFFEDGVYFCAGCNAVGCVSPLYTSKMKYDCGCGWPGFWTNIKGNVYSQLSGPITQCGCKVGQAPLVMTEILCSRCDGHLGHVYRGEGNGYCTDERHCVNSLSLVFVRRGGGSPIVPKYNRILRTVAGGSV